MPRNHPKSPRREPSQDRSRRLVAAVVEASAHVLEQHGHEGATIQRIADRAGVSVGSVYQYFGTKAAVLDALTEELLARLLRSVEPAMNEPGRTFAERIERALRAGFGEIRPYPTVLRQLASGTGTGFYARLLRARAQAIDYGQVLLEAHSGGDGFTNPALAARVIVDAAEGLLFNLRREDDAAVIAREGVRLVGAYCDASRLESREKTSREVRGRRVAQPGRPTGAR